MRKLLLVAFVILVGSTVLTASVFFYTFSGVPIGLHSCGQFVGPNHYESLTSMHDIPTCNGWRRKFDLVKLQWGPAPRLAGEPPPPDIWCWTGVRVTRVFKW